MQGLAHVNTSAHFDNEVHGVCEAVVRDCESMVMGVPIVPLDTTRTEWSSYQIGVDGDTLDAGDVDVDIEDSGVSGVPGV